MWAQQKRSAFTIVELLIVIVVIAILATISIVAYNGIQNRARASEASSALAQAKKKLELYKIDNGSYPSSGNLASAGVTSTDIDYQYTSNGTTYCITGTAGNVSYKASDSTSPTQGGCSGHGQGGVAAVTNLATSPHAYTGWQNQTPSTSTRAYASNAASDGGYAYQVTTGTSDILRISFPQSVGNVSIGDVVAVSLDINAPMAIVGRIEVGVNGTFPKSATSSLSPGLNRVYGEVTIPSGSAGNVTLVQFITTTQVAAAQTWTASRAVITRGAHTNTYVDGNSADWVWNGTTNNSTSTGPRV